MRSSRAVAVAGPAATAALVVGFGLLAPAPASAHTDLVGGDPAAGSTLDTPVADVTLTFSVALLPEVVQLVVRDDDGTDLAVGRPAVDGARVSVGLRPPGHAGRYEVAYRVVAADGHPVTGSYAFSVSPKAVSAARSSRASTPREPTPVATVGSAPWLVPGLGLAAAATLVALRVRVATRSRTR